MKVSIIISTIFILALTSCNSWLDVTPQDTVDEDVLFSTGDGYRNVLNGVYKQMATPSMYGKELSWGMLDVMGQLYHQRAFSSGVEYRAVASYKYTDESVKPLIQDIWSLAYNSIANCNSILAKIDGTDSTLFRSGNNEKMLIKGEALALRAFLHFDMLRLFAPAPDLQDQKTYIPYFKTYPSTFEPDRSIKEVLEFVVNDLEAARSLVAPHDTTAWRIMLRNDYRINYEETNPSLNQDLFFKSRGHRMNYLAVCALLARVYNYMGDFNDNYYQKAYDMCDHLINFVIDPKGYSDLKKLAFTPYYNAEENRKLYDGVIFCLSNQKLIEDYATITSDGNYYFYLQPANTMFDDNADIRQTELTRAKGSYQVCTKNIPPDGQSTLYSNCKDMLPMIRLSELYYIQAEHLCRKGDISGAINKMDIVRDARNCQTGSSGQMYQKIKDLVSFKTEMVKEAARDFMQEGQVFFYYKHLKLFPKSDMTASDMVLPKPDNELIH